MSVDVDMKDFSFSGEQDAPAAVELQVVDTNSYKQEVDGEFQSPQEMQQEVKAPEEPIRQVDEQFSKQEFNFKALREEVDRIKAEKESERREYQLQLEVLRANNRQDLRIPEKEPKKFLADMADSDVPSVADLRSEWESRESSYKAKLEELEVQQRNPDYAEVIEKYASSLAKTDPTFLEGLRGASNKAQFAYSQGRREKELQELRAQVQQRSVPEVKSDNAQRIVENAKKPGTLSQAGGQGALSKADYFANMSDKEFMEMATKNLERI